MNKKMKSKFALILAFVIIFQELVFINPNKAKSLGINHKVVYAATEQETLGGFKLISKTWIKDLKCNSYQYEHTKSGARLIFLDNKSDDKMFCVTFRTPTTNDTGVNHIIEHSVLQGSKNYPVKDPFIEMSKRSLNTFLNAFTATDHTFYPVSSKNSKDFQNLMNVYLDAVFYPNAIKDKKIFQEEGWRYELNSPEDELKYNGIVYNEMKGSYSTPEVMLNRAIAQSVFPDNSYKYEFGGHPDNITSLTYQTFVNTYKEYYTPSNSYLYLCGNLDINSTLKFIGQKYLNNFDKKEVNTKIQPQKPFDERKTKIAEYSIPKGTSSKNKTYLSLNYAVDRIKSSDDLLGFSLLQMLLTGTPSSPLSKTLKYNGFGEATLAQFNPQYLQPIFSISVQNTDESKKQKFQDVVESTLRNLVKDGFDKDLLNSITNSFELSERTVKSDFAITYNNLIMQSWIYDGEPTLYLNLDSDIVKLKEKIKNGYLEKLIEKYLLNNTHSSLVVLKPVPGLQEKNEAELKEKLSKLKKSFSKQKINKIVQETKALKKWQETPNSKEALKTLPSLTRGDIDAKAKEYKTTENLIGDIKVLYHPIYTNGVDYVNMYFDASKVPQEKLGYLHLLCSALGKMDTKNYTQEKLQEKIVNNACMISLKNKTFVKYGDNDIYYPKVVANIASLKEKTPKSFQLLKEIIYNSKLNDKERLKEIISNTKMMIEMTKKQGIEGMAIQKITSYMSASGKYKEYQTEGFYKFLCDLEKNFDSRSDDIIKNLEEVKKLIFNKQDMIVSYTGEEKEYNLFRNNFKKFSKVLGNKKFKTHKYSFNNSNVKEGIIAPSKVQYVVKGGDLKKAGYKQSGKLAVLANILQSDYLWNNIRIKGGAYGANVGIDNTALIFSSFRDPNLKETIKTINNIPEYLKNFKATEEQMTNYVIGSIGKLDNDNNMLAKVLGPAGDGVIADALYITEVKQEDIQKYREEILSTTVEDIRKFANVVDNVLKQQYLCVVGGEKKIKENEDNFDVIKDIMKPNSTK